MSAKVCPKCDGKNKKPVYLRPWFIGLVVIIILFVAVGGGKDSDKTNVANNNTSTVQKEEKKVPKEYISALNKAQIYSDEMYMSKKGIYDQLVSEYGEKFSKKAAKYAIKHVKANWKKNALEKAKTYQDDMDMSPSAIKDQLTSKYGEQFTKEQAEYAVKHLND